MATTWGQASWGDNSWNTENNILSANGIGASFNLGSAQSVPRDGWGGTNYNNGQWGDLLNSGSQVSGFNLLATLSEENVTGEINTGWGRFQWNAASWGTFGTLLATGQQLSSNLGSVTTTEEVNEGWSRTPGWSTFSWGIQGQALATGFSLSTNTGSVTIDGEVNIGWSSDTWGTESWGISGLTPDVTGIGLTATLGTPIASIDTATSTTGQPMTATLSSVLGSATVDAFATGIPITMSLTFDPEIVTPTGQQLTGTLGTAVLDANTIVELSTIVSSYYGSKTWGLGVWGNQPTQTLAMTSSEGTVDPEPDAVITGIQMTATLNNVVVTADANSGAITPIKWGEETWGLSTWGDGTYLDGSGYSEAATINLGTAILDNITIAAPSGQALTMQLNSVTEFDGNANVTPTGLGLTMALGTNTTLIWNQVDTGTAPVDPPGWVEVAA